MWTIKRVVMLIGLLFLFLCGYAVYGFFLGGIDGLPPLQPDQLPGMVDPTTTRGSPNTRELMIEQAFGKDCEELRRPIKLLVRDKGMVLAAGQFFIEEDGRVKLAPFSAALFPKGKDQTSNPLDPEINTVQCDFAFLTLDKPVQLPTELANRKVTAVELRGGSRGVTIINNRRTIGTKADDIEIHISMSPLFYEERKNLIWTEGYVKLQDFQSQPKPTLITGKGMEMHLSPESNPNKPKVANPPPRPKGENVSNVELVILRSNVNMHLYVDANDGFLGDAENDEKKAQAGSALTAGIQVAGAGTGVGCGTPAQKSHVFIRTNGPFTYDLNKEIAWFDCPPIGPGGAVPAAPEQVLVSREHPEKKYDQLLCDHLKLKFRKKAGVSGKSAPPTDTTGGDKEIEKAVATCRPGQWVYLTMDTQNLEAYGNELHYHSALPDKGPQTLLKGVPMRAVRDGHKIKAQDLHLTAAGKDGSGQSAFSNGPGQIDLTDKNNAKQQYPIHVRYSDKLLSTREKDGDKIYEKWTILGDASYIDEDQKQELRGREIHLWLEPNDPAQGAAGGPKQKIHKVEAFGNGNVRAVSQETVIRRANHLLIIFRPEVAPGAELPDLPELVAPPGKMPMPQINPALQPPAGSPEIKVAPAPGPPAPPPGGPANDKPPPPRPIFLDADDVVIYVATMGGKKQLESLAANGNVHVEQAAEKADEKGLDITGDLLNLTQDSRGDRILTVYGDARKLARLEMGETIILGPKVTIDQIKNHADVDGQGAMEMPSKTSLDGDKPAKPGTRVTIHWNKNMTFDGKNAHYKGGVLAYQDDSSVKCESMQAVMDRMVVFKESKKAGDSAKVERLMFNNKVYLVDEQLAPDGKRTQASILECLHLETDNVFGGTRASGPGRLRHLAPGDSDGPDPGKPTPKSGVAAKEKKDKDKQMMLTRIDFRGWMFSNTKAAFKNATFRDNVETFHVPSDIFEIELDADKLPRDGFYIRSEQLELTSRQVGDRSIRKMIATREVYFRNQECTGFADVMKFDDENDTIIFEAAPGNLVKLFKRVGGKEERFTGEKVLYNRKLGTIKVEKAGVINTGWLNPGPFFRAECQCSTRSRRLMIASLDVMPAILPQSEVH